MRTNHIAASLRLSLLGALGLLPLACAGSTDGNGAKPTCTSPQTDATSGIVSCDEGFAYRSKGSTCKTPTPGNAEGAKPRVTDLVDCTNDAAACGAFQYGFCAASNGGGFEAPGNFCVSGCAQDSDCGPGAGCRCTDGAVGTCTYGDTCDSDAACAPGYHCASSSQGCGSSPFTCQTARDTCSGTNDCTSGQVCVVREDGHRECGGGSICGRPFLVAEEARVAATMARGDWRELPQTPPSLAHLTSAERAALAEHWSRMGQMEHASIAAFARFSLQLLALGAPAELVEACTAALADETAHTKLCFGLASSYAGRAIGPGPLDVSQSLEVTSLAHIVDLVIAEGCFGETGAALEALEAAQTASDPVIVAAYSLIARDEQRHAELAFRFVRWALESAPETVSARIANAVASAPSAARNANAVATPCLEALLASASVAA